MFCMFVPGVRNNQSVATCMHGGTIVLSMNLYSHASIVEEPNKTPSIYSVHFK